MEVARRGARAVERFHGVLVKAILSLRKELGFRIDETFYIAMMDQCHQQALAQLDELIAKVESMYNAGTIPFLDQMMKDLEGKSTPGHAEPEE
jgi:hypothetical protein